MYFISLSRHENIVSVRDEIIPGFYMNIFIYRVVILALSLNPQRYFGKEMKKLKEMKGAPGSTRLFGTAAIPGLGACGALWVIPEVQVPLEIITAP